MAIQVVRFTSEGAKANWAVHRDGALVPLAGVYPTTRDFFLGGGPEEALAATGRTAELSLETVRLESPVTGDAELICQGLNYASHLAEIGRDVSEAGDNVFFMKASSSLCGPHADIVRPAHVQVLDYENELGLVLKRDIDGPIEIDDDRLGDWIGAFVVINDVSAREEQLKAEQFYKAKSYRSFAPVGPFLVLPEGDEVRRWGDLVLKTVVNGEVRQHCAAGDMVHKPVPTLRELAGLRDLRAGDLIATGTPGGVAMKLPPPALLRIVQLLPKRKRLAFFLRAQAKNPKVLRPGDRLELSIRTDDGKIDLGTQRNTVVEAR